MSGVITALRDLDKFLVSNNAKPTGRWSTSVNERVLYSTKITVYYNVKYI